MIKRKLWIVLMCTVVLAFTGCGDKNKVDKDVEVSGDVTENETATENETVTEKEEIKEPETNNKKDDTSKDKSETNKNQTNKNDSTSNQTSNKNETTTKPSTGNTDSNKKPNTGSTTKPSTGSTGNSGSAGNTQNNNTSTTTPSKPAHTHSWTEVKETVVVQEAWVEDVFAWRTICGKCGLDMTNMTGEELAIHTAIICQSRYSNKYIKIDEIHHPAVTEEQITGYKCECGATK